MFFVISCNPLQRKQKRLIIPTTEIIKPPLTYCLGCFFIYVNKHITIMYTFKQKIGSVLVALINRVAFLFLLISMVSEKLYAVLKDKANRLDTIIAAETRLLESARQTNQNKNQYGKS